MAIVVVFLIGTAFAAGVGLVDLQVATTLAVGVLVIAAVGWVDDTRGLGSMVRLAVHGTVALWTVWRLGGLPQLALGEGELTLGSFGALAAAIGIVWSINLFNFMDGIDGLAGSQAVIIFSCCAALLAARRDAPLAILPAIMASASLGFLVWNWPPARIFMGDVGSGALGYFAAALALASENRGSVPVVAIGIMAAVFITDATVTLVRRKLRRERLTQAHRSHAYQRLSRLWQSHRRVSAAAAALTAVLCLLGSLATLRPVSLPYVALSVAVLLAALLYRTERCAPM